MESKRISVFFVLLVAVLTLTLPSAAKEVESIYGHVSFVENQTMVIRTDQEEQKAVVNLPLVPGDTINTSNDGRCELQFDNGTVIRLDKDSSLRITTVNAPTLTSNWNITTLHLLQGQMYTLPQTYNQEMFQIITPNAAVNLKSRTAATIRFDADQGTTLFSDAGKFEFLYKTDSTTLKKIKVKSGQSYVIDANNTLALNTKKRNLEFVAWNEYVDRHFKELHYGINKVPPKLEFGSSALRYWAEHWSSLYGEWIYDELFGYVWKPAAEQFAHFDRPFFHADYVRINGRLFLVPQETWGWVPAHMGTWVWMKRGWTWIPGSWFHSGVNEFFARNLCFYSIFDYYFWYAYGGFDLYENYRKFGISSWRGNYYSKFHKHLRRPPLGDLPPVIQKIIKRINKAPLSVVAERLNTGRTLSAFEAKIPLPVVSPKNGLSPTPSNDSLSKSLAPDLVVSTKDKTIDNGELKSIGILDFSPDSAWAFKNKLSINYSSAKNAVVCPKLNISSDQAGFSNPRMRIELAEFVAGGNSSHAGKTSSTATDASHQAANNSVSGSAVSSAGSGQAVAKKDDGGK